MSTVQRGLDSILGGGTDWITFEDGKPMTLLFIDWYEQLVAIREHYEPTLNPKYIRCPGKEVCPLCAAQPDKYPALRVKFRVYDPADSKIKFVSLAKSHVKKINTDLQLDEIDPTKQYVRIIRSGKTAQDTSYSARASKENYALPNVDELDIPEIEPQVTPHTPEFIRNAMNALLGGGNAGGQDQGGQESGGEQQSGGGAPAGGGRKLPF
jgi:hypothetical protein